MSVSFSTLLYSHCFDMFARTITGGPYTGMRAIFNSGPLTITNDDGVIIADILHFDADTDIDGGDYEITDGPISNSGGQLTYYIRKHEPAAPLRSPSGWEFQ